MLRDLLRIVFKKIIFWLFPVKKGIPSKELVKASLVESDLRMRDNSLGIIFSKDRAMQLEALLGSYVDHVSGGPSLTVLYAASTKGHDDAYKQVFDHYKHIIGQVIHQTDRNSFRRLFIDTLEKVHAEYVFFLVDDILFIEPIDFSSFSRHSTTYSVPSMRMGLNLKKSYTMNRKQKLPPRYDYPENNGNIKGSENLICWRWNDGVLDWAYPLSVDGHIFKHDEILAMVKAINFDSPNTFEHELQKFMPAYEWRLGICYHKSRLVNLPFNRVQKDFNNISGEIHPDQMLEWWHEGKRIDRSLYYGMNNVSVHQEVKIKITNR